VCEFSWGGARVGPPPPIVLFSRFIKCVSRWAWRQFDPRDSRDRFFFWKGTFFFFPLEKCRPLSPVAVGTLAPCFFFFSPSTGRKTGFLVRIEPEFVSGGVPFPPYLFTRDLEFPWAARGFCFSLFACLFSPTSSSREASCPSFPYMQWAGLTGVLLPPC